MITASRKYIPGDIIIYDHRKVAPDIETSGKTLKCIQWNIERGYQIDGILRLLKSYDADIICLQELDIGCQRSGNRNCPLELATELNMKCAFLVEFEEIHSPLRSSLLQGGGLHGNAILSRFEFDSWVVEHTFHAVNWERDGGNLYGEPRIGKRAVIGAAVHIPSVPCPVICYSLHLEVFCGIFGRIKQFADVLDDCRRRQNITAGGSPLQLIFGDLNTMAHGIARLSPKYCCDYMRFRSVGKAEGQWWRDKILAVPWTAESPDAPNPRLVPYVPRYLSYKECASLRNIGFVDPFSTLQDFTVRNHGGLFSGKLDWTLCRNCNIIDYGLDNHDFTLSDHKLLYVVIEPILETNEKCAISEGIASNTCSSSVL